MKIIDPLAVHTIFEELPTSDLQARHLLYIVDKTSSPLALNTNVYQSLKMFRWQPAGNITEHLPRPLHLIFVAQQPTNLSEQLLTANIDWSCQTHLPTTAPLLSISLATLKIMAKANDNDEFYLLVANSLPAVIASQLFVSGALTVDGLAKFLAVNNNELSPYRAELQKIGRKKITKLICHPLSQTNPLNEYLTPVTTSDEINKILDRALNCPPTDNLNYDRYREDELIDMATSLTSSRRQGMEDH